jgi:hypothetical protein
MPRWRNPTDYRRRADDDLSCVQIMSIAVIVSLLVVAVAVATTYW